AHGVSDPNAPASTPQEQLKRFHVPPGFEVQLVASEPEIQKPINLNFDAAGRLWATGSELYPWPAKRDANGQPIAAFQKNWDDAAQQFRVGDKAPQPAEHGKDTVRILSDFGADGRARKIETFADGLNIPTGVQPLPRLAGAPRATEGAIQAGSSAEVQAIRAGAKGDSAIIFSIPNIWMMTDTDGDGRADRKVPLYEGFGFKDTHGMSSNYLHWIDGWIYGCHGFSNHSEVRDRAGNVTVFDSGNTYRFKPDGSKIEYYTHGQTNPFGLTVDPLGNFYSADSHSKPVYMLLRGGFYEGIGKQHDGLGFAPRITDDDHGSSAIAGIAYYADDEFPEEFRGNLFNGNPVTQRINRDRLEWHGSTPKAIRMPDFLTCDDPWFRPVQVKLGPDGALWIADFYNPIIGHYESPLTDPRRDNQHGRIWRVVWKGDAATNSAAPGSTGGPPVALGGPPSAPGVDKAPPVEKANDGKSASQKAHASATPQLSGGPPETTGQRPALPGAPPPDLSRLDAAALVEKLADSNLIIRMLATHELVERVGKDAVIEATATLKPASTRPQTVEIAPGNSFVRTIPAWTNTPAARALALWTLQRLGEFEGGLFDERLRNAFEDAPAVQVEATRILGAQDITRVSETPLILGLASDDPFRRRFATEALSMHSTRDDQKRAAPTAILGLLEQWHRTPSRDVELIYATRISLRDILTTKDGYLAAKKILPGTPPGDHAAPENPERLADVSLAVPTLEAADFLLTHLQR
ncbi:MAG TPA: hypothetical protein VGO90_07345, partial [Chthoniobacteraceae bacterium]|nr:hypothetical protein [Chthoniobacteraceae bacterium]